MEEWEVSLGQVGELRQHRRYVLDAWAEVVLKDGSMLFRGRVLDVSTGGCYVETAVRLRLAHGTRVEMVFRVREHVFRCEAQSRMTSAHGAGFMFERMDERTQEELGIFLGELERVVAR